MCGMYLLFVVSQAIHLLSDWPSLRAVTLKLRAAKLNETLFAQNEANFMPDTLDSLIRNHQILQNEKIGMIRVQPSDISVVDPAAPQAAAVGRDEL